ncbi:MAG: hypothetical protein IPK17_20565 [Chloroflexi bacterium]|uniref:hypothetical protein n=1 Tax=Candidatus Flexifilum breve TaxID=3140694 RepID=UPI0031364410|nr:hypothetical protein [Chloroflexota bacterium]
MRTPVSVIVRVPVSKATTGSMGEIFRFSTEDDIMSAVLNHWEMGRPSVWHRVNQFV